MSKAYDYLYDFCFFLQSLFLLDEIVLNAKCIWNRTIQKANKTIHCSKHSEMHRIHFGRSFIVFMEIALNLSDEKFYSIFLCRLNIYSRNLWNVVNLLGFVLDQFCC